MTKYADNNEEQSEPLSQVCEDADLDLAVAGAMSAKFRFGGQVCIAPNRFLVHEKVHDEFAAKMAARIRALKVGDGLESRTDLGPLINLRARHKVNYPRE